MKMVFKIALNLFFILSLPSLPHVSAFCIVPDDDISDKELIDLLSSDDPEISTKAAAEIFHIGERMIPLLVSCQGNQNLYMGYKLGDSDSEDVIFMFNKEGSERTHVTLEIVALYLIEAIYKQDLKHASLPLLYEPPEDKWTAPVYNSEKTINRAWASVKRWLQLLNKDGLQNLRKKQINPLFETNISFW